MNTLLVANRGEIARRIFRTARAQGIRCIAVYTNADAMAPFVAEADEAIRLPGGYLDSAGIVDAALRAGADAIHPGYGFLSENADFARAVMAAGITWVGPSPAVIETMGDKIAAKQAAEAAGVPTLPSSNHPGAGDAVGYPLLVKAAAGGGGKGMRIVESAGDLDEAVKAAQREALGAFGDARVFLERYVGRARHVEIQVLGDSQGNVVHLGERECSIQRRHQKILEESPSPVVDHDLRAAMGDAALRLAKQIGYESAGTVEFLLDDRTREFFFLEVNTRLQVEHPVTEAVTGVDLVAAQLAVAAGKPLELTGITQQGHAIEVRLYAEDAAAGFLPATGTLAAFEPADDDGVRWDSGVEQGSVVGLDFDPMLAKVIGSGSTRAEAAARLARSLERLHLGGVTTNRDFLVATLRHEAFLAGDTTTDFIARVRPQPLEHDIDRASVVAAMWLQGRNRAEATVQPAIPSGWRNARLPDEYVRLQVAQGVYDVRYRAQRDGSIRLADGRSARIHYWSRRGIDMALDGRRAAHRVTADGSTLHVQLPTGTVSFYILPRFSPVGPPALGGGVVAPMPGLVIDVRCRPGDAVTARQTLVVLEAMKMEHHVSAPAEGVVAEVRVEPCQKVENGALLLVLESGDTNGVEE